MSYNRRPSQSKSDSRLNQALKNDNNPKIEIEKQKLSSINSIPIPTKNPYQRRNEQNKNKENKKDITTNINNIKLSEDNNLRKDTKKISYYISKKYTINNNEKISDEKKNFKYEQNRNNINIHMNKNRENNNNKNSKEEKEVIKYNKIIPNNKPDNSNNYINKRNFSNLSNDNGNKFRLNFHSKKLFSDNNIESSQTPRLYENNNNASSYFNNYSQKTAITISKTNNFYNPIKITETESSKTRNKYNKININKSPSTNLNLINTQNKSDKHTPIRPYASLKHYNIPEPNKDINQNINKSSNNLLGRNITKERVNSFIKNKNINLNTDIISNKNDLNKNGKNINTITTTSHRKNSLKNKILNQATNSNYNSNNNTKKFSSYTQVQKKEEIKEKELSDNKNKNDNLK